MLKAWQVAAARTAAVARLLARSRTRKGERAQLLLGKVLRRWAELGQSRRRTADAELLEALSSLRAEKAALQVRSCSLLLAACCFSKGQPGPLIRNNLLRCIMFNAQLIIFDTKLIICKRRIHHF